MLRRRVLTRTGRDLAHELGEVALRVSGLSGRRIHDLDFDVHAGEIFGVAGLAGCGRSELARIVGGAQQPEAGSISVGGVTVDARSSRDAIDAGIAFVPPERARLGCIPDMSLRHNISLSDLSLDPPFC